MIRAVVIAVGALLALSTSGAAGAAKTDVKVASAPVLRPAGPWRIDYGENECDLYRSFGTGRDQIVLRLTRRSALGRFDGAIAGVIIPDAKGRVTLNMRLLPQSAETKLIAYPILRPDQPEKVIAWSRGDATILGQITDSQVVELSNGNDLKVALLLTKGIEAIKSLNKCHDDLLASWGADPEALRSIRFATKPVGDPTSWVTGADYPQEAKLANLGGMVDFMLVVDQAGKPVTCKVIKSSGAAQLDMTTCQLLMRRANFAPARTVENKPVTSLYSNTVNWIVPQD